MVNNEYIFFEIFKNLKKIVIIIGPLSTWSLNLQNEQNFKIKYYLKNRKVQTVTKTRLKFSNSKIAHKNTLNNFFVFFSKKYVKKKKFRKEMFVFGPFLKKL